MTFRSSWAEGRGAAASNSRLTLHGPRREIAYSPSRALREITPQQMSADHIQSGNHTWASLRKRSEAFCSLRAAVVLSLLLFGFHLVGLTRHGFWIDELHTYGATRLSFTELFRERTAAGHQPTYFIFVKCWTNLAGATEASIRIVSVFFGALAFLTFFILCRRFLRDRATFATALFLFFMSPYLFYTSQEARMYSILAFLSVFSSHSLLSWLDSKRWVWLPLYSLSVLIGLSFHSLFGLQIVAHGVYVLAHHRRQAVRFAGALAAGIAPVAPLCFMLASNQEKYSGGPRIKFVDPLKTLRKLGAVATADFSDLLPKSFPGRGALAYLAALLFTVLAVRAIARYRRISWLAATKTDGVGSDAAGERMLLRYCFYWIGVPTLIMYAGAILYKDKLGPLRYFSPLAAPVILLAGAGLRGMGRTLAGRITAGAYWVLVGAAMLVTFLYRGPGIREGIEFLKREYRAGDGVVFCSNGALRYSFDLYGAGDMDRLGISEDEKDKETLLRKITEFSKEKKTIWLLLHGAEKSPLMALFKDRPALLQPFCERQIRETQILGFTNLASRDPMGAAPH